MIRPLTVSFFSVARVSLSSLELSTRSLDITVAERTLNTMAVDSVPPLINAQLNYLLTHSPLSIKVTSHSLQIRVLGFLFIHI